MRAPRVLIALALVAGVSAPASAETDALFGDLAGTTLRYDISVGGDAAGDAEGSIRRTADGNWEVAMRTKIDVEVIGSVSIYTLEMAVTEVYGEGRLLALDVEAEENGEKNAMSGEADGDVFRFTHNGDPGTADRNLVPSTQLWRERMLERRTVLHVIDGIVFERKVETLGTETHDTGSATPDLAGYRVESPDETATLWFDTDGLLYKAVLDRLGISLVIERAD